MQPKYLIKIGKLFQQRNAAFRRLQRMMF